MKITLLAFAVIFLSASTFTKVSSNSETSSTKSTDVSVVPSSTETPPISSSSSAPTTTPSSSSAPTTTPSSSSAPTTTPSSSSTPTTTPSSSSTPTTTPSSSSVPTATPSSSSQPTTTPSSTPTSAPETTTSHETTSVEPTTSTKSPLTTTPAPIPVPEPGYWNVTEGNTTCLRAKLAIRFKIEINGDTDYILLLPTASTEGSKCNTSDGSEVLLLKDKEYNVIFVFEKKSDNVYVKNISFTYYLPFSTETFTNDSQFFEVKAGNSYLCNTLSNVILGNATMEILSIHIQAFGVENNKDFGAADECGADNPINDIVPIAVGVALLALVIVVLIAYLVGRRRSRQKGYQSV